MRIPMCEPDITAAERAAVDEVMRTPTLSIGPQIELFEREVAAALDAPHAAGVSSGTAGLHLCMIAADVGEGDLVLTTPFSFVASANCALYVRARPVFVDIDPETLTIDPEALAHRAKALLRRGGRSGRLKAILPVHVFGQPADMDPILEVARRHDLAVIEDACEAIGATYKGRPAGTLGDAGVFAFYPNKLVTTGEGGMIVTRRAAWDALVRSLRNQGRDVFDGWLQHSRLGYNYRLDELSAALGAAQVRRLDELLAKRERVAAWYGARLVRIEGVRLPRVAPWTTRMSWFVYVVRVAPGGERDRVIRELERRGIPARPYFPPIHLQPFYRAEFGFRPGDFPAAEAAGQTCLALPFSGTMREAQVDTVCGALDEVLAGTRAGSALRRAAS
ncbi:MAG TPA: DegT/DnrJ/EryC1/StrS family aminotransferase [Candidatus Binatus sp.]|nr:DegT/DnrJ/EryC1/StrS family aminotransferase [Candidatus Binatus sp.]